MLLAVLFGERGKERGSFFRPNILLAVSLLIFALDPGGRRELPYERGGDAGRKF